MTTASHHPQPAHTGTPASCKVTFTRSLSDMLPIPEVVDYWHMPLLPHSHPPGVCQPSLIGHLPGNSTAAGSPALHQVCPVRVFMILLALFHILSPGEWQEGGNRTMAGRSQECDLHGTLLFSSWC